jgi:hypothetical protein
MAFTSLNHYLDAEWMEYAFECTRKDGAVGIDGVTGQAYAENLQRNLADLIDRIKSGRYRALPVRRRYIDKPDGGQRALGIPSFEEKLAQRAIAMLLEPIYEQHFLDCSFGFRPGRNTHSRPFHQLGRKPKPAPIPQQAANPVSPPIAEHEKTAGEHVVAHRVAHQAAQRVNPEPSIGHPSAQEHPRLLAQPKHACSSLSSVPIQRTSAPEPARTSSPFGKRMLTVPARSLRPAPADIPPASPRGSSTIAAAGVSVPRPRACRSQ